MYSITIQNKKHIRLTDRGDSLLASGKDTSNHILSLYESKIRVSSHYSECKLSCELIYQINTNKKNITKIQISHKVYLQLIKR